MSTHVCVDQWHHADATEKFVGTGCGDWTPAVEPHNLLPDVIESRETRSPVLKIKNPAACRCCSHRNAWLREAKLYDPEFSEELARLVQ